MPDEKVNEKAEGYMILVCWDEISARLAGTDSTLRLHDCMWKLNFVTARRDSFPPGTSLDLHAFSLSFFVTMSVYEIENP